MTRAVTGSGALRAQLRLAVALAVGWSAGLAAYALFGRLAGGGWSSWDPPVGRVAGWTAAPALVLAGALGLAVIAVRRWTPWRPGPAARAGLGALAGAIPALAFVLALGGRPLDLLAPLGLAFWLLFGVTGAAVGVGGAPADGRDR